MYLTESEVSVAYRHLYALKCISESKSLGIIFEDDVYIKQRQEAIC